MFNFHFFFQNWEIYASNFEFFEKLKYVEHVLAKRQGTKRGWLTYTELAQLMPSFAIARHIINYSTILALSYVAGVMTLVGGFFVASNVPGTSLAATKTSCCSNASSTATSNIMQSDTTNESDLKSETEETELDYIMEDLNESIEMYDDADEELECRNTTRQMIGNWFLQNKCSPTSSVNNGILLRNYLDDNGHLLIEDAAAKNHTWSWTEMLVKSLSQYKVAQNHDKDTFDTARLVPAIWMKFI